LCRFLRSCVFHEAVSEIKIVVRPGINPGVARRCMEVAPLCVQVLLVVSGVGSRHKAAKYQMI